MRLLRLIWIVAIVSLCGCASINPSLWQPVPTKLVLKEKINSKGDAFGSFTVTIAPGIYTFWKSNEFGYIYKSEKSRLKIEDSVFGGLDNGEFEGGLLLSNRINRIIPVRIITSIKQLKNPNGLGMLVVSNELKKNGFTIAGIGPGLNPDQQARVELVHE